MPVDRASGRAFEPFGHFSDLKETKEKNKRDYIGTGIAWLAGCIFLFARLLKNSIKTDWQICGLCLLPS